jgi:hypothetical protein
MVSQKYYVYGLLDPRKNNQPFYIGKGCGDRARVHLSETEDKTENLRKTLKIKKIREAGMEPEIEYLAYDLEENVAYDLEATLIRKYGRAKIDDGGILTNICVDNRPPDPTGRPVSEATREKIGGAQRGSLNHRYGIHWDEAEKRRRSEFNKIHGIKPPVRTGPMSDEQKAAIAKGNLGKKRTAEQSAYLSSIRKGKKRGPYSEERRAAISAGLDGDTTSDLVGQQYGEWTVIAKGEDMRSADKRGAGYILWRCRCSCSKRTERDVNQRSLRRGTSTSCGCKKGKKSLQIC